MSAISPKVAQPAVLYGIDWQTYSRLLRAFVGRRFRLTYDRGVLEIMSPLLDHERPAYWLGRFIEALTEELRVPCLAGRSVTLRRRKKQRGLEPDNCYWIANTSRMVGKSILDLRVDPPPDLAIEVDVTSSSIDCMSIYAALGVPEVWRLTTAGLVFQVLQGGAYQPQANSLTFPQLTAAHLVPFLAQVGQVDDMTLARNFRDWVRRGLLRRERPSSPAPAAGKPSTPSNRNAAGVWGSDGLNLIDL
jgi:Uma2 family endonuclease